MKVLSALGIAVLSFLYAFLRLSDEVDSKGCEGYLFALSMIFLVFMGCWYIADHSSMRFVFLWKTAWFCFFALVWSEELRRWRRNNWQRVALE